MRKIEQIADMLAGFLADNNLLKQNYSGLIRHRRHPMPQPTVYSPEEISSMENSFDLSSQAGIRNYAITLFMTRYGIRARDVAALTFGDIDFDKNRLHFIQQKTGDPWEGELFPEVKTAVQNYMKNVRPNLIGCSRVFISLAPPYAPIDSYAINSMAWNQFRHANIDIAGRKHGSRAFRSSIASNMVNDGVPTEIVRKVLGHGTEYALKHYARIDMKSMRLCPISVSEPTGIFAEVLSGKKAISHV
nr:MULTISPECIES: tyrosine-type recombinase/integrase [Paenibacillaceae]